MYVIKVHLNFIHFPNNVSITGLPALDHMICTRLRVDINLKTTALLPSSTVNQRFDWYIIPIPTKHKVRL